MPSIVKWQALSVAYLQNKAFSHLLRFNFRGVSVPNVIILRISGLLSTDLFELEPQ